MKRVTERTRSTGLALLLIVIAGVIAYWNSFDGAFVYDDLDAVRDNPHIRRLWPPSEAMSLPMLGSEATVDRRPVLSLSFALNHALFGPEPWGYHLVNLMIHIAAGLLLFGVVRRTIQCSVFGVQCSEEREQKGARQVPNTEYRILNTAHWRSTALALSIALLWLVHPLHTQSVTYIVQRAESLMGMLYLLTLYCAIRGFAAGEVSGVRCQVSGGEEKRKSPPSLITDHRSLITGARGRWHSAAILACALGMGTKEVMATAPLIVLLYDSIFVSGSLRQALRRHRRLYAGLAAGSLILVGVLWATTSNVRGYYAKTPWFVYAMTQPGVILHYLRLTFWPTPLLTDYVWPKPGLLEAVLPATGLVLLLATTVRAVAKRRWYGFLGAWFFVILAPTSSIVPLYQVIFEHRMYLPLAAIVAVVVLGVGPLLCGSGGLHGQIHKLTGHGRRGLRPSQPNRRATGGIGGILCLALVLLATVLLTAATRKRNLDYHTPTRLWAQNLRHEPRSFTANLNMGKALAETGRSREAAAYFRAALAIAPGHAAALHNLGKSLADRELHAEAESFYRQALQADPDLFEAHGNLGLSLLALGRREEAIASCRRAAELEPRFSLAHSTLGRIYSSRGEFGRAIQCFRTAAELAPDAAPAHSNLGVALTAGGRPAEALPHFREAVRLDPSYATAYFNWGNALIALRRPAEAAAQFRNALRVDPGFAAARHNLATALKWIEGTDEP